MTADDLKRVFLGPALFRLDIILAPRLLSLVYATGLAALLLWAISHLFWSFGAGFGNGLWGILETVVFGGLWLLILRIACEGLMVYFAHHSAEVQTLGRSRLPAPLVDDVADAITDLARDLDELDASATSPVLDTPPPGATPLPPRGGARRTARRTPPVIGPDGT